MPNSKSAKKRIRRVEKQTLVNRSRKNKYRTLVKEIRVLIQSKKKKEAQTLLPKVNSQLMRVSKTGAISFSKASRLVSSITGFSVQPNKAIVGANAFAHEAGIHQDGMLKHSGTYEIMTPESVGLNKSSLVLGKHSGKHAFSEKLKELGYELGDNALMEIFGRFKDLADKKKDIFDEDIIALVGDQKSRFDEFVKFVSLSVNAGSLEKHEATIILEIDKTKITSTSTGNGPVDATFNAIKEITKVQSRLKLYQVHAITAGTDAQGEVTVRLEDKDISSQAKGSDPDIIVASAKAYISALNRLVFKKSKSNSNKILEIKVKGV